MQNQNSLSASGIGWLGFELSVLRRLKFRSVALPLAGEPNLGLYLKRWDTRVAANDPAQWAWTKSQAFIENNCETLTEQDLDVLLDDAYVPRNYFRNRTPSNVVCVSPFAICMAGRSICWARRFILPARILGSPTRRRSWVRIARQCCKVCSEWMLQRSRI